jgi:hypothetical protein
MSEQQKEDWASVRIATKLSPAELIAFCQDAERLLRINSMYEFEEWRSDGGRRFFMRARNLSNGREIHTPLLVEPCSDGIRIVYEAGLKTATTFRVEPLAQEHGMIGHDGGAVLVVTDDYSGTPELERPARISEVDQSLVGWGRDLQRYLRHWARWSGFGPWRWYMRRLWQPMKPKARRITFMLLAITAFELVIGVLAIAGLVFVQE